MADTRTKSFTARSTIGLKKLAIALLTKDDDTGHTYGTVQVLEGPINVTITPQNTDPDIQYAGDVEWDVINPDPEYTVAVELADLPLDLRSMVSGHTIDDNGVMIVTDKDTAPYVAIGLESEKSNHKNRAVWLYKARAVPVTDTYQTKEGATITRQTGTVEFTAIKRTHDGKAYAMADEDTKAGSTANWLTKVYGETT